MKTNLIAGALALFCLATGIMVMFGMTALSIASVLTGIFTIGMLAVTVLVLLYMEGNDREFQTMDKKKKKEQMRE
jgi:membrane protein implicated in regulation of membrane protease activity